MENARLILAVCAALLAFGFLAVWLVRGRQRLVNRSRAALYYSVLLLASAAVLYRGSLRDDEIAEHRTSRESSRLPAEKLHETPTITPQETKAESRVEPIPNTPEIALPEHTSSPSSATQVETFPNMRSNITTGMKLRQPPMMRTTSDLPMAKREAPVEEVIEAGVLQAFDLIEVLFERYGSSISSTQSVPTVNGSIKFANGTAQLSAQSVSYLRNLASLLENTYKDGQIEIRAQTNETVGSTAERLSLTESRAAAVRDVLAAAGFPLGRLVPIGSEKAGENRVKFVHRPN